ncbi:peroxisomal assembly protein [Tilletia horrida]|nr:peroxisomal assembly protein [Tilletia horrida]
MLQPDLDDNSLSSTASDASSDDGSGEAIDAPARSAAAAAADGDDDDDDDAFDISIDEGFLGHSVLQGYTAPLPADGIKARDKGRLPISSKNVFDPALLDSQRPVDEAIAIWRAASQQQQTGSAGEDEDGDSAARATEAVDDHSVVLVPERDFAQLACFNGDWAIIELTTERIPRLVRLFAHPCPPKAHRSAGRKQLYMTRSRWAGSPPAHYPFPSPSLSRSAGSHRPSPSTRLFLDALRTYFQPPVVYFRVTALAPEATDPEPLPTSAPSSSRPSASSNSPRHPPPTA